jgi:rhomboid protease GluP
MDMLLRYRTTAIVMAVIVVVSLLGLRDDGVVAALAKDNERIYAGEMWRMLTCMLVHGSVLHLFMNMMALWSLSRSIEDLYGPTRAMMLLFGAVVVGSLTSVVFLPGSSVGASGGVFGLLGCLVAFVLEHRKSLPPAMLRAMQTSLGTSFVINVLITFSIPRIDWAAHVGGFLFGAVAGYLLPEKMRVHGRGRQ